jgi:hypothetical protein
VNNIDDGFLVVLSDVKSANDRDYLNWLTTEHVQERLGIPGFLAVRIFRVPIDGGHRYLIWYRLASADIVDSPAYLERLNHPTEWSQRIMPILGNFGRGGGRVAASVGHERGSTIRVVGLSEVSIDARKTLAGVETVPEINSAHVLITDLKKSEIRTNERELRTNNRSFAGLLIVESESENSLSEAILSVPAKISPDADLISGIYREVFSLAR